MKTAPAIADILTRLLEAKAAEVARRKAARPLHALRAAIDEQDAPRGFVDAIARDIGAGRPAVIGRPSCNSMCWWKCMTVMNSSAR